MKARGVIIKVILAALALALPLPGILLSPGAAQGAAPGDVLVVLSGNRAPYLQAARGARELLEGRDLRVGVINVERNRGNGLARRCEKLAPRLVMPVGRRAVRAVLAHCAPSVPVVFSMILSPPEDTRGRHVTGVLLEASPKDKLRIFRALMPSLSCIGLIHTPATSGWAREAVKAGQALGIKVLGVEIDQVADLPRAQKEVAERCGALMAVADPAIYNPTVTQHLIMFALRYKIPFMGLSRTFVQAGALMALEPDYRALGRQAAGMALEVIEGRDALSIEVAHPRQLRLDYNTRAARRIGLELVKAGEEIPFDVVVR